MEAKLKLVCLVGFSAVWLCATGAAAQVQAEAQSSAATPTPTPLPAQPSPAQPAAGQMPSAAPGHAPEAYYPPPGYAPPPAYYPPPGYAPPPGYYPPPGYAPPGAYYPQQVLGPPPGHHLHDGFYMRLTMGLGYLSAKYSQGGQDATISGGGMAMAFAFGGSVTPNLVIYGEFMGTVAMDPTLEYGGTSRHLGFDVNLFGIGPGVAYYLEPMNMYFSGTLAFSQVTASSSNSSDSSNDTADVTEMGMGASFMVGKEWWVSHDWGLGIAGMLHLASMKMKNVDSTMTATAFSVVFSATYN